MQISKHTINLTKSVTIRGATGVALDVANGILECGDFNKQRMLSIIVYDSNRWSHVRPCYCLLCHSDHMITCEALLLFTMQQ